MFVCPGVREVLPAEGLGRSRRREDQFSRRSITEVLKNLIDLWTFIAIRIQTSGKELPEFVGYARVAWVSRHWGAFTLNDLVQNLRISKSMKRLQPSQHLDVILHLSPRSHTPEYDGDAPAGSASRTRTCLSPSMVDIQTFRTWMRTAILEPQMVLFLPLALKCSPSRVR